MSNNHNANAAPSFVPTLLAVLGGFSIFLLILFIAYLPKQPEPLGDGVRTPAQRKQVLLELKAKEQNLATTYGWIDQPTGVVRLPVDRAVELTLKELQSKP